MTTKKRSTPPIIFAPSRPGDPSLAIDAAYFEQHPDKREYTRRYIRGETPEPQHPDTMVIVAIIGFERVRGFAPPPVGRVN